MWLLKMQQRISRKQLLDEIGSGQEAQLETTHYCSFIDNGDRYTSDIFPQIVHQLSRGLAICHCT
jgi:hypothetical protein